MPADGPSNRGSDQPSPSLDETLELLSQYQRREIIRFLRDVEGNEHPIGDVIDHLAAVERERGGRAPGEDHLLSVLVHVHGPKLEEAGVVDYDGRKREIRYYPDERVERALDRIESLADDL